ncbi:PDDEXK nuclease domain-containing protein [Arenibacter sp. GZD96]|uniref:PDDEXK nuclease domain-containing protein n=1 Tax=Aurantibrevibacter litoralis TaxID=3106030 RepID=UPI002AFE006C|nr:PDDEXK nuclease domain-containing protein [Arenibacter sp. GZD-96]MEA1786661.1 PDDEXK nuclease domain-containing protein [Arenibacter sp. GZD-96]
MNNFNHLSLKIAETNKALQHQAIRSINKLLTLRNWLIGYFIVEYEQIGSDRAEYGSKLIKNLAKHLNQKGLSETNLKLARQFYQNYAFLGTQIRNEIQHFLPIQKSQLSSDFLFFAENQSFAISQTPPDQSEVSTEYIQNLLQKISFSHFVELLKIEDPNKRQFYEWLIIKSTLSVAGLKQKITSLTYERVELSEHTENALQKLQNKITPQSPTEAVKSIYLFDFLNIPTQSLVEEKELETALLSHLQAFILELGNGFCFEARQKRILIDDQYYFADLVFYHRILKCHVIVELKVDAFKHEHLSQLNTYVAYFNREVQEPSDNPAVGILLCTEKGEKLVEYATAGMDNQLFVSKYLLKLPQKEDLKQFLLTELKRATK